MFRKLFKKKEVKSIRLNQSDIFQIVNLVLSTTKESYFILKKLLNEILNIESIYCFVNYVAYNAILSKSLLLHEDDRGLIISEYSKKAQYEFDEELKDAILKPDFRAKYENELSWLENEFDKIWNNQKEKNFIYAKHELILNYLSYHGTDEYREDFQVGISKEWKNIGETISGGIYHILLDFYEKNGLNTQLVSGRLLGWD